MNNQRLKDCIEQELNFIQPDVERGWREIQDKIYEKKERHIYQIRPVIVIAILLMIIVIPVGSTAAYELFQRTYHLPIGKQKTTNEDILMTDNVVTVEQNREQNALFENIEIEWTGSYVKDELAIISFQMKTIDETYENIEEILHIIPTGKKIFTMTVVCDEESKETIRQMVFQNASTGFCANAEMPVRELEDGRLQFCYSVNYDGSYVNETYESRGGEKRDTTMEDLQQLVLKLGGERVIETLLEGTIEEVISIN